MRPTVHDIAREAGVSLATVDRVLNERPGVRDRTIARVKDAVDRLGYVRDTHAANLARRRSYRFAFVLPEGPSQFVDTVRAALAEAHAANIEDRVDLKTLAVPTHDPHATVRRLRALNPAALDGIALMVPETPQVRDAVARLKQAGPAVIALVSDLPTAPRDRFVGIDNVAAGRTAAVLMGRFVRGSGEILVASPSMRARDSVERRLGFDAVMAQDFPDLRVLPSVESHGDAERMEAVVGAVAAARPDLVGVYSMGTGTTPLLAALRRSGRSGSLVAIAHELTAFNREALLRNELSAVISQNVGHLVRSALRVLRALSDDRPIFEPQERIRIDVILRENLP